MKYTLFILLMISNFFSHAQVCFPSFNFDKVLFQKKLADFRSEPSLPPITPLEKHVPSEDSSAEVPQFMKDAFRQLVLYAFGKSDTIKLKACLECSDFVSVYQANAVFYPPKELENIKKDFPNNWQAVIRFILAHELAHMIHEKITLTSLDGKSPQGNISLIRYSPEMDFQRLKQTYESKAIYFSLTRFSKSHLEVDGIAILLLQNLGFDGLTPAIEWRKLSAKESKFFGRIDTYRRLFGIYNSFFSTSSAQLSCPKMSENEEVNFWLQLPEGITPFFE